MKAPSFISRLLVPLAAVLWAGTAATDELQQTFAQELERFQLEMTERHGFDRATLDLWFAEVELQQRIIDLISAPAERVRPWHEYREIFLTDARIDGGVDFWREHEAELARISGEYGVPPEVIVAIIGVETFYGRITGSWRVLDALSTLGFAYSPRASFFRSELEHFLLLAREERLEPRAAMGSYAGAMGSPQFIPSSYRAYAVDGSGNGQRDLFRDWSDILASVANYFRAHGWRSGQPVVEAAALGEGWAGPHPENSLQLRHSVAELRAMGYAFDHGALSDDAPAMVVRLDGREGDELWVGFQNFEVITRYNRSLMYALAVHQLSQEVAARMQAPRQAAHGEAGR
jgi:membrane-bound lytic murein transglycosylase B